MMPKTSVSPAAIRNSITPSCSPFSACSRTRRRFTPPLFHPAFLVVRIPVVGENRLLDLHHGVLARRSGYGLQQVEILNREVVAVVAELAARRGEFRLLHRCGHALRVR